MDIEGFAKQFAELPPEVLVYCPEGLSRFYWGGFSGKPVASWMTSLERDYEIDDFCTWLDRVYVLAKAFHPSVRVCAFGFSQGAATVMRWLHARRPPIDSIVLWSGTPPEDIDYQPLDYFTQVDRRAYWGEKDELVSWERASQRFEEVPVSFEHSTFVGGHAIEKEALMGLVAALLLSSSSATRD